MPKLISYLRSRANAEIEELQADLDLGLAGGLDHFVVAFEEAILEDRQLIEAMGHRDGNEEDEDELLHVVDVVDLGKVDRTMMPSSWKHILFIVDLGLRLFTKK